MRAILTHGLVLVDVLTMKLFVSLFGWNGELLDSHLFFFDRYSELAEYHRRKGHSAKADRLAAIAEAHYQAAPGDDEPPAAEAMAMPVPRPPIITNAVSTTCVNSRSTVANRSRSRRSSGFVPVATWRSIS